MKQLCIAALCALLSTLLLAGCSPAAPENSSEDATEAITQATLAAAATEETSRDEAETITAAAASFTTTTTKASKPVTTTKATKASKPVTTTKAPKASKPTTAPSVSADSTTSKVTSAPSLEQAKEIALKDAGRSAAEVRFTKAKTDREDGVQVYEIEFVCEGREYEYTIHAGTGSILERDIERGDDNRPRDTRAPYSAATDISLERAKEIALKDAGRSATEVRFTKAKLDHDDGIQVYEIEFVCEGWEYEYTIHAGTGAILESDWDR